MLIEVEWHADGVGSELSPNGWVSAASQLDNEVVDAMKDLKWLPGKCVWDNEYLMGSGAKARSKMKAATAIKAVALLGREESMKAAAFVEQICMPMKVLEVL